MRKIKVKLTPSLEQDDIEKRLQEALVEENANTTKTDAELQTPLNNKQGFDPEQTEAIEQATATEQTDLTNPAGETEDVTATGDEPAAATDPVVDETPAVDAAQAPIVTDDQPASDVTVDETVSTTTEVPTAGGEVTDVVAEAIVEQTAQEGTEGVRSFVEKMRGSFELAKTNGFEGNFDEFLLSLTKTIGEKEVEQVQNPLGTTDGAGGEIDPTGDAAGLDEPAAAVVADDVQATDATLTETTTPEDGGTDTTVTDDVTEVVDTTEGTETTETTETSETTEVDAGDDLEATETTEVTETTTDTPPDEGEGTDGAEGEPGDTGGEPDATPSGDEPTPDEAQAASADDGLDTPEDPFASGEDLGADDTDPGADDSLDGADDPDSTDNVGDDEPKPEGDDDDSLRDYIDEIDEEEATPEEMVKEAIDSSTQLGRIAELVKEAIEEGKEGDDDDVKESIAKIAEIANESYRYFGKFKTGFTHSISTESFANLLTPNQRCKLALENLDNTITKFQNKVMRIKLRNR